LNFEGVTPEPPFQMGDPIPSYRQLKRKSFMLKLDQSELKGGLEE